jgi:hypothetical protein
LLSHHLRGHLLRLRLNLRLLRRRCRLLLLRLHLRIHLILLRLHLGDLLALLLLRRRVLGARLTCMVGYPTDYCRRDQGTAHSSSHHDVRSPFAAFAALSSHPAQLGPAVLSRTKPYQAVPSRAKHDWDLSITEMERL